MSDLLKSISLAALVALAGPVLAQDTTDAETSAEGQDASQGSTETDGSGSNESGSQGTQTDGGAETGPDGGAAEEAPSSDAGGLSMGKPADESEEPGTSYVEDTFGDWEQRCVRTETGADPCQLYQLLRDDSDNAVAEMSLFPLPAGREAAAGSTIITPLETLLTRSIRLSVDNGEAKRYPFEFCTRQGCIARVGFTDPEIAQFKRGAAGKLFIVPAAAPDQEIELTISLSGFTAGYEAVTEANANADELPEE